MQTAIDFFSKLQYDQMELVVSPNSSFQWVPVNERKPVLPGRYPVVIDCDGRKMVSFDRFSTLKGRFYFDRDDINVRVTHWYELPELPQ